MNGSGQLKRRSIAAVRYAGLLTVLIFLLAAGQKDTFEKRSEEIRLAFVKDIPLPGGTSRFDYQSIDGDNRRLYISHMESNSVIVFDTDSNKVISEIKNIRRPTGILVVPDMNRVFVSASAEDRVYVINASALKITGSFQTERFPDGIAYDPESKRVFVSNESGRVVTVFDSQNNRVIRNIELGGEVGNTHYDSISGLIYSTVQTRGELVAIDPHTLNMVARYKLSGCKGPHGFYIDETTHSAFITGEDNAAYVVFDLTIHRVVARGTVGSGPDVLAFDKKAHILFVASESGVVSAFELRAAATRKLGQVFFAPHAHSVSVDQKTGMVYFPLQDVGGHAVLRVMRVVTEGRPTGE